ncbi:GntR family transcriptional regulator [Sporosarcina sp. CAU 1771]
MYIKIEPHSEIPIYTQLVNALIEGVASGSLREGKSLPSVRSLAADLGVNMHTVNKAYHELEKKGIVQIIPKSGVIVNPQNPTDLAQKRIEAYMRPVIAEALAVGIQDKEIISMVHKLFNKIEEELE